jgi:putative transposase
MDREVIGYELALRSRAKEVERAVEAACLARYGTLRPAGAPVLRSDNGLIFQSRRFRQACRDYRLRQELITPYTAEQNGIIERFFRSLKEECVCSTCFSSSITHGALLGIGCSDPTRTVRIRPRISKSDSIPRPASNPGGLISGDHYICF